MSRRVLILSDLYAPHFAPRIVAMATHWTAMGWAVTVVTEDIKQWNAAGHGLIFKEMEDVCSVHRIPLRKSYSRRESIEEVLLGRKSRLFQRAVEQKVVLEEMDILVAFSYRNFPLRVATNLAKKYHKPVVLDCRDLVEQYPKYKFLPLSEEHPSLLRRVALSLLRWLFITQRDRTLRLADGVTTVSPWHQSLLQKRLGRVPIALFYNGFEEELFVPKHLKTDRFRIIFAGRLLSAEQGDPSLLFDALSSEVLHPLITSGLLEVVWHVDDRSHALLAHLLAPFSEEVKSVQHLLPMIPFAQIPSLLANASLVLILAKPNATRGIVSTKIFEAIAMEKPIALLRSDEGLRAEIIERSKSGWSINCKDELVEIIQQLYAQWQKNGYTCNSEQDKNYVRSFSRERIASAYASFLEEIIAKKSRGK